MWNPLESDDNLSNSNILNIWLDISNQNKLTRVLSKITEEGLEDVRDSLQPKTRKRISSKRCSL